MPIKYWSIHKFKPTIGDLSSESDQDTPVPDKLKEVHYTFLAFLGAIFLSL